MATFTVDTTADTVDAGDGQLSLREALALADGDPTTPDTVVFDGSVQGKTIVLAGSQLTANSGVTIDGGSGVTIDADGKSRVLQVQGDGTDALLRHLTITGGHTMAASDHGGGIRSEEQTALALDHTIVSGNSTAGDYAFGGGIYGYGYVTLTNSTVSGNSTTGYKSDGGGINCSHVTLTNSTVSGNSTAGQFSDGGGIFGYATLINSTVSGNSTAGDDADGGGIEGGGYATNSIVAGNTTSGGTNPDVAGSVQTNGLNIFGSEVAGSAPSDRENVSPSLVFAALDPLTGGGQLGDNGGPTQTIALRDAADNPALGRGDPETAPATDQRGEPRPEPAGTNPDIGAFELDQSHPSPPPAGATFVVTTTSDVTADDGQLTLREALALADADSLTKDRIEFAAEVQGQTITLAGSQLTAGSDVTVDGGAGVTIDAAQASRVLLVQGLDTDAVLQHLTITGGRTTDPFDGRGGGILAGRHTTLALDHTIVSGNSTAAADGGGIVADGYVSLTDSTVSDNSTEFGRGGGIYGGSVKLTNSTVSGNSTAGDFNSGGGIYGHSVTLANSTVSGNSTAGKYSHGGGIYGFDVTLTNSTVSGNSTAGGYSRGGGIHGFDVTLTNSTVSGNSTAGNIAVGGGIYGFGTLANSIVAGNNAAGIAPDVFGGFQTNGLNIFGSEVAGSAPSDRENVSPSLVFAALDPLTGGGQLGDNGGPTQSIALRDAADNPALGRSDPESAPATDQRGEPRPEPAGTDPDIGAFELDQSHPSPPPVGATFVVTTTSDVTADDGQLTLREALALADADSLTKDRIEFAAEVQEQTITLAGSQLTASSDVTVDGGAGVTLDAAQASRVLLVQGLDTDAVLQHLTITGGRTTAFDDGGGGILAGRHATLALDHTIVSGNSTGGVNAPGGGIYALFGSNVTLTNSTVSGNSTAGDDAPGGGIGANGYVTLTNSTVSGNSTAGDDADGGGIAGLYRSNVTLTNSTVSGNSAAGDDADGGGIYGTATLVNSIVAGNNAGIARDIFGSINASNGHNIFGSDVEGNVPGDLENAAVSLLFAALDPETGGGLLADNGGSTRTVALRDASDNPALAGADPADAPATDQRGVVRPAPDGTNPDIGAFELNQSGGGLNEITGTQHDDFLRGTAGADLMRGLGGDDRLWGRDGDDQLFGGAGRDVVAGKGGSDEMTGGDGADRFLFRHLTDAPVGGPNYDDILDFRRAQHDRIDV